MSNFGGNAEQFLLLNASDSAHGFTPTTAYPLAKRGYAKWGPEAAGSPAAPPRLNSGGWIEEQIGGRIFERVLSTPQIVPLGNVFTEQIVPVVIWNTFRALEKYMTGVTTSGPGSAVPPPFVFPVAFPAMSHATALITVPAQGDATIDQAIVFVFPVPGGGPSIVLVGQRLAVFSVEADWAAGITETPQIWMTDVLRGLTDAEQRVQLRTVPRSRLKFKVLPTGRETAFLEGLLNVWQQFLYGVPFWPDKQPLTVAVAEGDVAISFDWTDREFAPGGYAVLWRDALTVEVIQLTGLISGGATLAGGTLNAWAADGMTWVVPIRRGRLPDKVDLVRKNQETAEADLTFEVEVV